MLGEPSDLLYLLFKAKFDCSSPLLVTLESVLVASIWERGTCLTFTSIFMFSPIEFLIGLWFGVDKLLLETVVSEFFVSNSLGTFWLREDKLLYVIWVDFAWEYEMV